MVVSSFSCSGIPTGDLNPIYNVPMLGTHNAWHATRNYFPISPQPRPNGRVHAFKTLAINGAVAPNYHPMRKKILSLILVIVGLAVPLLQSYWVSDIISMDPMDGRYTCNFKKRWEKFGFPAFATVIEEYGTRPQISILQPNLSLYFTD